MQIAENKKKRGVIAIPYLTLMQSNRGHQITFEDVLYDRIQEFTCRSAGGNSGTVTFFTENPDTLSKHLQMVNIQQLVLILETFNSTNAALFEQDRKSLYHSFYIPKKSGGYRTINEPLPELMTALRQLKLIFEKNFNALYHTSAFAYMKGRCAADAVRKHQRNRSRWFLKTDFSDFFGSTTEDFLFRMVSMIFPFSEVVRSERGANALRNALSLCFLDGGLPQGTPISPLLTNLMMIPIDHRLANDLVGKGYVYTRYADDISISHRESFDYGAMCRYIGDVLARFDAPFAIKPTKTRYGSSAGKNWMLGVMLNKDNKITIGRKNKEYLKAACRSFVADSAAGVHWDPHDVNVLSGKISYYKMVEKDYIEQFIQWFNQKHGVNLMKMIRDELSCDRAQAHMEPVQRYADGDAAHTEPAYEDIPF